MDNYEFLKRHGSGSYAVVWKARRRTDGRIVAIKQLKEEVSSWAECKDLAEVKYLSKLRDNPAVVKLIEVVRAKSQVFLVFEYCESNLYQTMHEMLGSASTFSDGQIRWVVRHLLEALAYVHSRGYMHRDLKPENVLLTDSPPRAKLCDFGQCKAVNLRDPCTGYVATRWYRAPEIILRAKSYGPAVDVWAVGVLMAELFTLRPIFAGSSELDMLFKISTVLGTPSDWREGQELAAAQGYTFPDVRKVGLASLIPQAGPEAIEFMATLLVFDPARRPTAKQALAHPYLNVAAGKPVRPLVAPLSAAQEKVAVAAAAALVAQLSDDTPGLESAAKRASEAPAMDKAGAEKVTAAPIAAGMGSWSSRTPAGAAAALSSDSDDSPHPSHAEAHGFGPSAASFGAGLLGRKSSRPSPKARRRASEGKGDAAGRVAAASGVTTRGRGEAKDSGSTGHGNGTGAGRRGGARGYSPIRSDSYHSARGGERDRDWDRDSKGMPEFTPLGGRRTGSGSSASSTPFRMGGVRDSLDEFESEGVGSARKPSHSNPARVGALERAPSDYSAGSGSGVMARITALGDSFSDLEASLEKGHAAQPSVAPARHSLAGRGGSVVAPRRSAAARRFDDEFD